MNALSYALFGYNNDLSGNFPFAAYFRGLSFNIKMAELIYPAWRVHVILDRKTYNSFQPYFDYHVERERMDITVVDHGDLCMLMLQRMMPVFSKKYDRILCRDVDSLLTYRERQAVEYWITTGRIVHCMTDSVSHNIALMGGMIGFTCKEFCELLKMESFDEFTQMARNDIDFRIRGADQIFLNRYILPKVAHSMVEHYLLGLPQSFRGECYNYVQDVPLPDVPPNFAESNKLSEHIGASGFNEAAALRWLDQEQTGAQKEYYKEIEDQYKEVFYWRVEI